MIRSIFRELADAWDGAARIVGHFVLVLLVFLMVVVALGGFE